MTESAATGGKQHIRVLVVEDDTGQAQQLTSALHNLPYYEVDTIVVTEITKAITKVSAALFDMIFLDLSLPRMSSVQPLDELRGHTPGIPIIVLTEPMDSDDLAFRALDRGAQDYLAKGDYDDKTMSRVVRHAMNMKQSEEQIAKLVHYDPLTGVANRYLFNDRLSQAVFRSERSGQRIAILFIDLDHFHGVNEALGYEAGDFLLKETAKRIVQCVRRQDTISRLGGDEFAVILEGISDPHDVSSIAKQMLEAFQDPFHIDQRPVFISLSVGISVSDEDALDGKALIKQADIARYRAKEHGRNNFQYFEPEMNAVAQQRLNLEQELNQALDRIFRGNNS